LNHSLRVDLLQLATDEAKRILARITAAPGAMVAYSMGRSELAKRTPTALTDAARYFTQAIAADPSYAAAYAELANAYTLQASYLPPNAHAEERDQYLTLTQVQVDKSLELDANSGAAWAAQGLIYQTRRDQDDEARTALRKAIDLNPSLAMAHMWYGSLMDDTQEQEHFYAQAFELDPRSPVAGYNLANVLLNSGREAEAMAIFSKIVEADPNYPMAYELIAKINNSRGRLGEAIRNYEKLYEMQPSPDVAAQLAILWGDIGDFDRADDWIGKVEQTTTPGSAPGLTWLKIGSYVARGNPDAAEALMRPMLDSPATTTQDYLNAAHAGYFLGEYQRTIDAYERARAMVPDRWDEFQQPQGEADVAVAFAYHELGRDADAEPILVRIEEKMDSLIENGSHIQPDLWFAAAQVSAIRGATNLALIHLQRSVDEGWRQHWRPYVEPCLKDLLKEQAFVGMMQGLAIRLQLIREQIAFEAEFDEGWGT